MFSRTTTKSMSAGPLSCERRLDAGEQLHRAQVDVLVEPKRRSSSSFFEDAGGDVGMADGAEEDRVELAELVEAVGGERFAGFEVAVAAPVEIGEFELEVLELGDGLENFDAFGGTSGPVPSPPMTAIFNVLAIPCQTTGPNATSSVATSLQDRRTRNLARRNQFWLKSNCFALRVPTDS